MAHPATIIKVTSWWGGFTVIIAYPSFRLRLTSLTWKDKGHSGLTHSILGSYFLLSLLELQCFKWGQQWIMARDKDRIEVQEKASHHFWTFHYHPKAIWNNFYSRIGEKTLVIIQPILGAFFPSPPKNCPEKKSENSLWWDICTASYLALSILYLFVLIHESLRGCSIQPAHPTNEEAEASERVSDLPQIPMWEHGKAGIQRQFSGPIWVHFDPMPAMQFTT